jgi:hypothetical protein
MTIAIKLTNFLWVVLFSLGFGGCAYRFGYGDNRLSGGYQQVAVPVFRNISQEPGVEIFFTNALIRQFSRSKVTQIVSDGLAPVTLEGTVSKVQYVGETLVEADATKNKLPRQTVLYNQYRVYVTTDLRLIRNSDQKVIWEGQVTGDRVYLAPKVEAPGINTVNPLYNQSARRTTLSRLADDMMLEAHDRATESF